MSSLLILFQLPSALSQTAAKLLVSNNTTYCTRKDEDSGTINYLLLVLKLAGQQIAHSFHLNEMTMAADTLSVYGSKKNTSGKQTYESFRVSTDNTGIVEVKVPTDSCSLGVANPTKGTFFVIYIRYILPILPECFATIFSMQIFPDNLSTCQFYSNTSDTFDIG